MEEKVIPADFDNRPVIGPTVEAFLKLLAEIASRHTESEREGAE